MNETDNEPGESPLPGRAMELLDEMLGWKFSHAVQVAAELLHGALAKSGRMFAEAHGAFPDADPNVEGLYTVAVRGHLIPTLRQAVRGMEALSRITQPDADQEPEMRFKDLNEPQLAAYMKILNLCMASVMPPGSGENGKASYGIVIFEDDGVAQWITNVNDKNALADAFYHVSQNIRNGAVIRHDE